VTPLPPSGDSRPEPRRPQFPCLASYYVLPGGTMLEWKFRLVILLAAAAMIAAALGNLGWHSLNLGW